MDIFNMDIFKMSLSASILIVAVVIIRTLALHKLPKKTFLALWGIVLCRLLIPFSVPYRFSFYTGIGAAKRIFSERAAISPPAGVTISPNMLNLPGTGEPIGVAASAASISPFEIVWLAGMCACALFYIVAYIKCRKEFKMSLPILNDFACRWLREHPLRRPLQIRQSDRIKAPLTYGIIRPVILLPKKTDWTDETGLRYILSHEFTHIKRFDTLTKLALAAAVCVHWFNPFVWIMHVLANRDIELSCDETVIRTFGEKIKSAYALTLIGLEEKKSRLTPLVNNFSKNAIEERIVSIMKTKQTSLIGIILALALIIGTATVFATSAAKNTDPYVPEFSIRVNDKVVGLGNTSGLSLDQLDSKQLVDELTNEALEAENYEGFNIIRDNRQRIIHIKILSGNISTYRGITVGSTKEDVLAAYPEIVPEDQKLKALWYENEESLIEFYFLNDFNIVSDIQISYKEKPVAAATDSANSFQSSIEPNNRRINAPAAADKTGIEPAQNSPWVWPVEGYDTVTSAFGTRYHPVTGTSKFSDHINIAGKGVEGAAVCAALAGTVSKAGFDDGQGNFIVINHNNGVQTIYRHLGKLQVSEGNSIAAGDKIGTVGATGKVTGTCLAFSVYVDGKAVNPMDYIR